MAGASGGSGASIAPGPARPAAFAFARRRKYFNMSVGVLVTRCDHKNKWNGADTYMIKEQDSF